MATIQSIVEQGTLRISGSIYEDITSDKYIYQGNVYSDKPPALALMGSIVYFPMDLVGIQFGNHPATTYYLITLLTIGVISALGLAYLWKILVEFYDISKPWAGIVTFLAGVGTLVFAYSTVFNPHAVCGSLLAIGFYYTLHFLRNHRIGFLILSGLIFTLAGSIDILCLLFIPFILAVFLRDSIKHGLIFLASCLPFLTLYLSLNVLTSGSPLPPALNAGLMATSESAFSMENLSGLASHTSLTNLLTYSYHSLIGKRGLISHTPILLFAIYGIVIFVRERRSGQYFLEYLLMLIACGFYIVLILFRTTNYSGNAFGIRWFAAIMLILMISVAFLESAMRSNRYLRYIFWSVSALSIMIAIIGSYRPFLPSISPVVGDPSVVENTIIVGLIRLLTLASLEGQVRTVFLFLFCLVVFATLVHRFSTEEGNPQIHQA
jgi:hypothetical protein